MYWALERLASSAVSLGKCFTSLERQVLLHDEMATVTRMMHSERTYQLLSVSLYSCVTKNCCTILTVCTYATNARAVCDGLIRNMTPTDISLSLKDHIQCAMLRSSLMYG